MSRPRQLPQLLYMANAHFKADPGEVRQLSFCLGDLVRPLQPKPATGLWKVEAVRLVGGDVRTRGYVSGGRGLVPPACFEEIQQTHPGLNHQRLQEQRAKLFRRAVRMRPCSQPRLCYSSAEHSRQRIDWSQTLRSNIHDRSHGGCRVSIAVSSGRSNTWRAQSAELRAAVRALRATAAAAAPSAIPRTAFRTRNRAGIRAKLARLALCILHLGKRSKVIVPQCAAQPRAWRASTQEARVVSCRASRVAC